MPEESGGPRDVASGRAIIEVSKCIFLKEAEREAYYKFTRSHPRKMHGKLGIMHNIFEWSVSRVAASEAESDG